MTEQAVAYLSDVRMSGCVDGDEVRLDIAMPWAWGDPLHLSIRRSRYDAWERVESFVSGRGPIRNACSYDVEPIDLTVALTFLGLTRRLPREESCKNWDGRDLLPESFRAMHGREPTTDEAGLVGEGVRSRLRAEGFDTGRILEPAMVDLMEFASDFGFEATDFLTSLSPALARACREFPMLASEILASTSVTEDPGFDGDVAPLLLEGRLGRENGYAMRPFEALAPHVVDWLRGLRIATPEWDRYAMNVVPELANGSSPGLLPRSRSGLESFLRAAWALSAWTSGMEERRGCDEEMAERLAMERAGPILANGGDWDAVARDWKEVTESWDEAEYEDD